jgi:hypothetical protein
MGTQKNTSVSFVNVFALWFDGTMAYAKEQARKGKPMTVVTPPSRGNTRYGAASAMVAAGLTRTPSAEGMAWAEGAVAQMRALKAAPAWLSESWTDEQKASTLKAVRASAKKGATLELPDDAAKQIHAVRNALMAIAWLPASAMPAIRVGKAAKDTRQPVTSTGKAAPTKGKATKQARTRKAAPAQTDANADIAAQLAALMEQVAALQAKLA